MQIMKRKMFGVIASIAMILSLFVLPTNVNASTGYVAEVGNEKYVTLSEALEDANNGDTIKLIDNFALSENVTIKKDITLDLNGHTVTMGDKSFKINESNAATPINVTVMDSTGNNGKLSGSKYIIDINANSGNIVNFKSGIMEGTGSSAVIRVGSKGQFIMTGGIARHLNSKASYVLLINSSAAAEITGGRIEGSTRGISLSSATSQLVFGQKFENTTQTEEDAKRVYTQGIYSSSATASITVNSGTVGKLLGNIGTDFVLNGWFEQDVSNNLPAGMMCVEVDGHWEVKNLTQENSVASIGDTYYASLVKAASDLKDNETLVLLKDYSGSSDIKVKVDSATIDLNGYKITNTSENGYGLKITSSSSSAKGDLGVKVINSSSNVSAITASIPLYASSGNSNKPMPIFLDNNINLISNDNSTLIELGTSAYIEYNEKVASCISTGGFLATHSDGKQYVHGSFTQAAKNDINHTAKLLNDYENGIALSSKNVNYTLDLNGHTVTSQGESVIRVNTNNSTLMIKNGTMITKDGTGAEVGIPAGGGVGGVTTYYNNVTLDLENVNLIANGTNNDDFGIVCNGLSTGINIHLKGGSVTATDMIGIYMPADDSHLTIDGTKITGTTGVAIKGGTVNIENNANIIGTGDKQEPSSGENSGVNDTGAAIYVEGNYDRDIQVNIANGIFKSNKGLAVQMLKDNTAIGNKNIIIKGGTFSSDVAEYVAEGYKTYLVDNSYKVVPETIGIELSNENINIPKGNAMTLTATLKPEGAIDEIRWSSDDSKVATVDANGKVTAVGAGKATITAKAGNQTATCKVTVYEVDSNISAPTIDTSKPVDSVTVGINDEESQKNISDTLTSIVDDIANEKEVTSVNQKTAENIKQAINDGKVVSTEVQVKPVETSQVDAQDKKVIEDYIDEKTNIAQYIDISVVIKADNEVIGEVNELNKEVTFTVAIPEDLMKEGRTFYVIRVHDGKVEKLDTVENGDGTLTFKTDKFSTYALAYEDAQESTTTPTTPNQPNNPEQPTQPGQSQDDIKGEAVVTPDNNQQVTNTQNTQETAKEPKTGDTSNIALYGAMALISLGLVGAIVLKKKVSEK